LKKTKGRNKLLFEKELGVFLPDTKISTAPICLSIHLQGFAQHGPSSGRGHAWDQVEQENRDS
jgi:hypothetical protein